MIHSLDEFAFAEYKYSSFNTFKYYLKSYCNHLTLVHWSKNKERQDLVCHLLLLIWLFTEQCQAMLIKVVQDSVCAEQFQILLRTNCAGTLFAWVPGTQLLKFQFRCTHNFLRFIYERHSRSRNPNEVPTVGVKWFLKW